MRGPKAKPKIICRRCGKKAQPVREFYCKSCASVLVRKGELEKILVHNTPKELSAGQEQVLNGLMLGDGCLYRRKPTHTPYLVVTRKQDDRNYLIENYETFKEFCKRGIVDGDIFDKRTGNTTYFSKFVTRRCRVFEKYYRLWYPDGNKVVPKDFELTPLTAAIWFSDDGHIRYSCSKKRFKLQLSTESFGTNGVEYLRNLLQKEFDEYFYVTKDLRIGSSDAGAREFIAYIDEWLPPPMSRKAIWRNIESCFYDNQPKRINPDIGKHGHSEFHKTRT